MAQESNMQNNLISVVAVLFAIVALAACAGVEDRRDGAQQLARGAGFSTQILRGDAFELQTFYRAGPSSAAASGPALRVYIEGDGFAWISRYRISPDPTPRNPVGLKLAAADHTSAVFYIARPCQFIGVGRNPNCTQKYWTSHRFAPEVIASTSAVIDQAKKIAGATVIELVGFSGGGAVAVLVAARRSDVASIRTVAGNLDHVTLHRRKEVPPLTGSLNAVDVAAQVAAIPQIHYVGAEDEIIGAYVAKSYRHRAGTSNCIAIQTISGASHTGGWDEIWPSLVASPLSGCK
ncbi:MAG: alpha/beta hydrolase [Proteobacteria bacterium]|nr:alpha/beta hydrolase [Pseudomonadota bacterium]MDA1357972.1 alpha/beta hydrolase [Pseudomonadota bacterium]